MGFVFCKFTFCQTFTFIYIDKSNTIDLDSLRIAATKLISITTGDKILFISNDKTPIISTDENGAIESLDQLGYIRPNTPDAFFEVDTINTILTYNLDNYKAFNFHFFLDPSQTINKKQIINLVERLLLCNNLLNNKNTMISLHFENGYFIKNNYPDYFNKLINENKQYALFLYPANEK